MHGFSGAALKAAAEKAGVNPTELKAAFPNGGASLVEAFSHWADEQMAERMREAHHERTRDRVTQAVKARLEVLVPLQGRRAARGGVLGTPAECAARCELGLRTVDLMWRAAGDRVERFLLLHQARAVGRRLRRDAHPFPFRFERRPRRHLGVPRTPHRRRDADREIRADAAREWVAKLPDPLGIFGSGGNRP